MAASANSVDYTKKTTLYESFEQLKEADNEVRDECQICLDALTCTEALVDGPNKTILGIGCAKKSKYVNTDDKTERVWKYAHQECMEKALKRGSCPFCRVEIVFNK